MRCIRPGARMLTLVSSPVRFFEARRRREPDWPTALAAPALCAWLQGMSAWIFSGKSRPIVDTALARIDLPLTGLPSGHLFVAMSVLAYPMFFGLLTLAVLAVDVLAKDTEQPARLTEFTALGFYTQVPYCLLMIVIAWVWAPEPIRLPLTRPDRAHKVLYTLSIKGLFVLHCPGCSRVIQGKLPPCVGQLWGQEENGRQELPPDAAD